MDSLVYLIIQEWIILFFLSKVIISLKQVLINLKISVQLIKY